MAHDACGHQPIMLAEVLACLRPAHGDVAVDATLGGGGHAQAILERIQPGGRLIGLDVDGGALARTEARLRESATSRAAFTAIHASFTTLETVLAMVGVSKVDVLLLDLGVSSMQVDDPARGLSYKVPGPLDMRFDRTTGESAASLVARLTAGDLEALLVRNADEPHAEVIAGILAATRPTTTQAAERAVRVGLSAAHPALTKAEVKMAVRRTFQALRVAVNDELNALDTVLRTLPAVLAPHGRVAVLTFHSGEDRRVKKAFADGYRRGVFRAVARAVVRSSQTETFSNRKAAAAKLRWAVAASPR